jgi:hypothetical protein
MKKLVNVYCDKAFSINGVVFSGVCRNIILRDEDIAICLEFKAKVDELLEGGKVVSLGFDNFRSGNGPSKIPNINEKLAITESYKRPEVETITGDQFKKDTEKKDKAKETPVIEDHRKEVVASHEEESETKEENTSLSGSLVVENKDSAPKKDARSYYKK